MLGQAMSSIRRLQEDPIETCDADATAACCVDFEDFKTECEEILGPFGGDDDDTTTDEGDDGEDDDTDDGPVPSVACASTCFTKVKAAADRITTA